jgi:hypothetical protein
MAKEVKRDLFIRQKRAKETYMYGKRGQKRPICMAKEVKRDLLIRQKRSKETYMYGKRGLV